MLDSRFSPYFSVWRIDMGQQLVGAPVVLKTPLN